MNEETYQLCPRIAVLGICDACQREINVDPRLAQLNILRLRNDVVSPVYPLPLRGFQIIVAMYDPLGLGGGELTALDAAGKELFKLLLDFSHLDPTEIPAPGSLTESRVDPKVPWMMLTIPWPNTYPTQTEPGSLTFRWHDSRTSSALVGGLNFLHVEAAPLSPERIAAIQSDPLSSKRLRLRLGCTKCNDILLVYGGIERNAADEKEGYTWYRDLPEHYECRCGTKRFSLLYIRNNLHGFLGQRYRTLGDEVSFARVYELNELQLIYKQFKHLLDGQPSEEAVQKFVEEHTVLLHQFSPEKIFPKAPILTKFKTDFVILSKTGQLFILELEKPEKRLLRKDGGRSAEFTQACDQVLSWHHELRDHRIAILDSLGIDRRLAARTAGVVIMGRDEGHDADELMRLKSADLGGVEFYTYDDLLASLAALIRELGRL